MHTVRTEIQIPISTNVQGKVFERVYSILLRNKGNTRAKIDNDNLRLDPGEMVSFGNDWLQPSSEDFELNVQFENFFGESSPTNRLEVVVRRVYDKNC